MRITIDIRSLQDPYRSGVGVYTEELLRALFQKEKKFVFAEAISSTARSLRSAREDKLGWLLFANAFKNPHLPNFDAPNVQIIRRYFPNRPLNLWMRAFGRPTLDGLIKKAVLASPPKKFVFASPPKAGEAISSTARSLRSAREDNDAVFGRPREDKRVVDCFFMPNLKFGTVSQNVPLVVTVHDLAFEFAPEFYPRRAQWSHWLINPRRLLARADRIIAVSHATKSDLVQLYGLPEEKITVIYPGPGKSKIATADLGRPREDKNAVFASPAKRDEAISEIATGYALATFGFATPPAGARNGNINEPIASGAKQSHRDILFLGTVEPRKNIPGLIHAFGLIADKYPETRLIIAGFPGWGERQVEKIIREQGLGIRERIVRIPDVDAKTREELFTAAAVFAYPSFYEGFGFPVVEAMNRGVPVVTGNMGSLPEVVGDAGLLADPDDPRSIATAIDAVLSDNTFASKLKERGMRRAEDFSWENCAAQTLEVLCSSA